MKHRFLLVGWLIAVVAVTMIHTPDTLGVMLGCLLLLLAVFERDATWGLLLRALFAVALVNLAVSVGFALVSWSQGEPWLTFVLRLNLRVFLVVTLTLWMARHVRIEQGLAFSPRARYLTVLIQSQIRLLGDVVRDTRHAFESRNPVRAGWRARLRGAGAQSATLLDKAETHATALNEGMRSRGYFDRDDP